MLGTLKYLNLAPRPGLRNPRVRDQPSCRMGPHRWVTPRPALGKQQYTAFTQESVMGFTRKYVPLTRDRGIQGPAEKEPRN